MRYPQKIKYKNYKTSKKSAIIFEILFHKCKILNSRKKSILSKVFKFFQTVQHSSINTNSFFF